MIEEKKDDKHSESGNDTKPIVIRRISGCVDCPFCLMNDMAAGYSCKIDNARQLIRENKKFMPITPNWCPLKQLSILVKYGG
jgi:hypothetical protein